MNKDILKIITNIYHDKIIKTDQILELLEESILDITKIYYKKYVYDKVKIDTKTGNIFLIKNSSNILEERSSSISIDDNNRYIKVEKIDIDFFNRSIIQNLKRIISYKINKIEEDNFIDQFKDKLGEIFVGDVSEIYINHIVINLGDNIEGIIFKDHLLPREKFSVGDITKGLLYKIKYVKSKPQLILTRYKKDMVIKLLQMEIPEIKENLIEIKKFVRIPGYRTKIALKSNNPRIDTLGACIGVRGMRIKAIINSLNGEKIDLILWDQDIKRFIRNAFLPISINIINVNHKESKIEVMLLNNNNIKLRYIDFKNVNLISKLIGWKIIIIKM